MEFRHHRFADGVLISEVPPPSLPQIRGIWGRCPQDGGGSLPNPRNLGEGSAGRWGSLPLHNGNLLFRQPVQRLDQLINLPLHRTGVRYYIIPQLTQPVHGLEISQGLIAFVFVTILLSGWLAELLGQMVAITGAFLAFKEIVMWN